MSQTHKLLMPDIFPVASHTKNIGPGSTFVAIKGLKEDGTHYILEALKRGATQIVIDETVELLPEINQAIVDTKATITRVKNTRKALADLSAKAANINWNDLTIIGVTGTKGKSTTTHMLFNLFKKTGASVACLNSVYNMINDTEFTAPLTTAQPDYLQQFLKLCVDNKVHYVVMEVAAQAFTYHRIDGIQFDAFIFTNLEREHGELYPTIEDYLKAKCELFMHTKINASVFVNSDDAAGAIIIKQKAQLKRETYTNVIGYSLKNNFKAYYNVHYKALENKSSSVILMINNHKYTFSYTGFSGFFNAYNVTAALLALNTFIPITPTLLGAELFTFLPLRGRCEEYNLPNGARVIIDYAHTPNSFDAILRSTRQLTNNLIVIFGAGGGKDHEKRPMMGCIAAHWADTVILTSDNPRHEDPVAIVESIKSGIKDEVGQEKVIIELDRQQAIELAYQKAQEGTIIMLLGKGPDEYQIIGDVKMPFSEKQIVLGFK
ncbi:UDP-N-acetylmuramoyl-L-alanyl-D-glutamate--2,6-diaminopimelate ligase [bacterium]|nr:UDP-N-acetylmuramoyl-L-alanyl-D-glutamate--2,6-diaminopimelate ligase [bacterium]